MDIKYRDTKEAWTVDKWLKGQEKIAQDDKAQGFISFRLDLC